MPELPVWTLGHSNRSGEEFVRILQAHEIEAVVDVRRFPGSRRLPQFSQGALESLLTEHGIAYGSIPALGGRRRPDPGSLNTGWTHPAFRAYADHVQTDEFAGGLLELLLIARGLRTAVMCAEALWWRCHRRLIADVLVSLGIRVIHIYNHRKTEPHRLSAPGRIERGVLNYGGD